MIGLALGLSSYLLGSVRIIGVVGGMTLVVFGALQVNQARKPVRSDERSGSRWDQRSGVIVGLVFTGINPFFLIWWATVDSLLIAQALLLGAFVGVFIMFAAHISLDYAWLGGTAGLTARGRSFLGKWYRILLIALGIEMLFFGIEFIISAYHNSGLSCECNAQVLQPSNAGGFSCNS